MAAGQNMTPHIHELPSPCLVCHRMLGDSVIPLPHIYGARIKGVEVFCPLDPPPPYEAVAGSSSNAITQVHTGSACMHSSLHMVAVIWNSQHQGPLSLTSLLTVFQSSYSVYRDVCSLWFYGNKMVSRGCYKWLLKERLNRKYCIITLTGSGQKLSLYL